MCSSFKPEYGQLSIFQGLTSQQVSQFCGLLEFCRFPKGTTIFQQGQMATNLFILLNGEVMVSYKPYDGPPLIVARVQPGGVFGWSAALGREAYTSGATAEMDVYAYRVSGTALHHFCKKNPQIAVVLLDRLASVIAERLRNTHDEVLGMLTRGMDLTDDYWRRLKVDG